MDEAVLEGLRRRDAHAIARFRATVLPRLTELCQRILGVQAHAQEIAEDVWLDFLMSYLDQIEFASAVPAYLRVMAVRRCVRVKRQRDAHLEAGRPETQASPEEVFASVEARLDSRRLADCLAALTSSSQRVLRLRFHADHTQEEIGEILGVSKQYIGRVLRQCLDLLKRCMEAKR